MLNFLTHKALHFANENAGHVFVLSIPDWSATPFAQEKNFTRIRKEIDSFNDANKFISAQQQLQYVNINPLTREVTTAPGLLAADGLHYSGDEYKKWAYVLAEKILTNLKITG